MPANFRNVFVLGAPYCGSTLLGRVLDNHSRIACVGELGLLGQAIANRRACSCGRLIPECEFWRPILAWWPGRTHRDYRPADYEDLRAALQADVLIDLSKSLCWRMLRWPWSRWWDSPTGFLYLVRDSRAVIASDLRRNEPLDAALAKHFKWERRFERLAASHRERTLVVQYEKLCAEPEAELRRICCWIGIDYEPRMARLEGQEYHFAHSSRSAYARSLGEIRLDLRWRSELTPAAQGEIERRMQSPSRLNPLRAFPFGAFQRDLRTAGTPSRVARRAR